MRAAAGVAQNKALAMDGITDNIFNIKKAKTDK
jgi:hypothetical protein